MIKTFDYRNGEIKITYNESPAVKDYKYDWKKYQIGITTFPVLLNYRLGVELEIRKGGRICYGMLGVQVQPEKEINRVKIDVAFTKGNSIRYYDSCLFNGSRVYKGLPEEYLESVIRKVTSEILKRDKFPQYKVLFEYAANCEVGSSPMIYGMISEIIINIISENACEKIMDMDIQSFTNQFAENVNLHY